MIPALLLAAALGLGRVDDFRAAFPAASTTESPAGGRLTHASRFEARGLGRTPEAAARAFLARYGAAFGVGPRERLVARGAPAPGRSGRSGSSGASTGCRSSTRTWSWAWTPRTP